MPPISRQARNLKKAREIRIQKLEEAKKNEKKRKINEIIDEMNESELDNILELIKKSKEHSVIFNEDDPQRVSFYYTINKP